MRLLAALSLATIAGGIIVLTAPAEAQTYVRAGAGIATGNPEIRDYQRTDKRNPFISRVTADADGPTIEAALGHDFGTFRLEANIGGNVFATDKAGCIDCPGGNPGFNGVGPYNPEGRKGYHWGAYAAVNALVDLPLTDRLTLSGGGGIGAAYHKADTGYAYGEGWLERGSDVTLFWQGIAQAAWCVSDEVCLDARYAYQDWGRPEVAFTSNGGTRLAEDAQAVQVHAATAGVTYRFGGE